MSHFNAWVTDNFQPLRSLQEGHWFKLICGASFQSLPDVRNLALVFSLVGADCLDVAADPAVVQAAKDGIAAAHAWLQQQPGSNGSRGRPWIMVSLNDGEDPHFRKAFFDPQHCPPDCLRPCETICPAAAIAFPAPAHVAPAEVSRAGVLEERCYGCGRCLPICPIQQISTQSYVTEPGAIAPLLLPQVDALEIHTQVGRLADFERLWRAIAPHQQHLKALAISCPDGDGLLDYLWSIHQLITPITCPVIWQTDGRPMSGDIGKGTTHAAIRLGQKVLRGGPPGYVQLAGGTNLHTVPKLRELGLLPPPGSSTPSQPSSLGALPIHPDLRYIHGIAYGSFARSLIAPLLQTLDTAPTSSVASAPITALESDPALLRAAIQAAHTLIAPLKQPSSLLTSIAASRNHA